MSDLFNRLGNQNTASTASSQQTANFPQMFQQFRQNPMKYLGNLNIPQNIAKNPQAIVQHLANTGQIPPQLQSRVNAMLGRK